MTDSLGNERRFKMGFPRYLTVLENEFPSTSNFVSKLFYLGNELACFKTYFPRRRTVLRNEPTHWNGLFPDIEPLAHNGLSLVTNSASKWVFVDIKRTSKRILLATNSRCALKWVFVGIESRFKISSWHRTALQNWFSSASNCASKLVSLSNEPR